MYELEEISRDGNTITARMIPMKETRRYENGNLVIEFIPDNNKQPLKDLT